MQPEDLVHLDEWTPEQQVMALKYRIALVMKQSPFSFTPRPSDVIVAVPGKSRTTWVSHICHQLRMRGAEPDFDDQDKVVVWMEKGVEWFGLDPNTTPQAAEPRLFKSHLPYGDIPAGGKMIYCFRDLKDVVVSAYHFMNTQILLHGRVSLPIFVQVCVQVGFVIQMLETLLVWWDHRHDDNILFLFFDDLKEDHPGCVRRIAKFIDIECSEEILKRVVHTTTHAEMSHHSTKFASLAAIEFHVKKFGEKPPTEIVSKVRTSGGRSGDGQALPVEMQQYIEEKWTEIVTAKLGFKSLKEMRAALHKELML